MLSTYPLFQEVEEWIGLEEEVVAMRREVGCQWESPEEERKDVGCQSDSADRRDVAVQVDLLTQQLCGMSWRCVAVRADEPGGGALLQHCGTPRSRGHTLHNTLLPIMPLWGPASGTAPMQPESKDIQLTVPSPSTAPADTSGSPPPGLIAPLSPRLAEEQEEEEEEENEGPLTQEISKCVSPACVNKQPAETVETKTRTKRKSGNPVQPTLRSSPILQRRSRRRMSDGERINQSEKRRNARIKTQDRRRNIQTGHAKAQRKHTAAEGMEDKNMEAEKENEKLDEVMMKKKRRRRKKADGLTPVKMNSEVTDRPRRKAVGPPIRYLLEYEERSHGKAVSTLRNGRGPKEEEEKGRKKEVELEERSNSSREVDGGMVLKQLHLSIQRKGSRRRGTTILRLRRFHHHNTRGRHRRNTPIPSDSVDEPEEEVKEKKREAEKRRRRSVEKVGVMVRNRKRIRREKEIRKVVRRRRGRENLEEKLAPRPKRTMVGPPIRYLLESEEQSHGQETDSQDAASDTGGATKPQKKKPGVEGQALDNETTTTDLTEKETESINQDAECSPKRRSERTKKFRVDSETAGGASGGTDRTGGTRRERQRLRILRRIGRRRSGDETEKPKGPEEEREEEVNQPPQRQRRSMVGPPIRYLLESEEQLHGQEMDCQDAASETGGATKPQKKVGVEVEALDDRTTTTELTEKQKESTNQDAACSSKHRKEKTKRAVVVIESASALTNFTTRTRREKQRLKILRRSGRRRSEDQTVKPKGPEEEREEEVNQPPQRQRRSMVGPPIRYLLESEEQSSGLETASRDAARETGGTTKPQKKKTGVEVEALDDRTTTTELTEKQKESTNQDAACSPKHRVERTKRAIVVIETASAVTNFTRRARREKQRVKILRRSGRRRSEDQTVKPKGPEEEREEEVNQPPQRQQRSVVGPPIRYLLESEEQSHGQDAASHDVAKKTGTQPQKKTGVEGDALEDRTTTTELTEKETETTHKDAACSPKCRAGSPKKDGLLSETVGGASDGTGREKWSGDQMVKREEVKIEREVEVREPPQRQRRIVGTPTRNLLAAEEQSHDWEVAGTSWEVNSQEKSQNGGLTLKQETEMIDKPEDIAQKVRQEGETDAEIRTSLMDPDRPKRRRQAIKVRGQSEGVGGASEVTEIAGQKATRRRVRKKKRGAEEEEVRQVSVNDGREEKMEADIKEGQTDFPKRPRRTMVGPPIRYLLESEEQSHGWDSTNQGLGCIRKPLKEIEAGGGAVEDAEGAKHRARRSKKVSDDSETGGGATERQTGGTDTETKTSPHTQTHLIYSDTLSGQVTVFFPCSVRLQHLP